ncbi:MAG: hypothetical protein IKO98_10025 [Bacteroidales bacterium]|nr:hypothetical protein [Bacteroidales bacterium]MBR4512640.1 hypothetical protein [Bacteroidales bacterium]
MKNTIQIVGVAVLVAGIMMSNPVSAQSDRTQKKENKELKKDQKELHAAVYQKSEKMARKEAKKLEKEGWKTMGLPIVKQLDETWMKMYDREANGYPRYIWAQEMATANSFAAAQSQADNIAKLRIASQVSSSVAALTDIALANQEISAKDAASITKTVENAKTLVSQKLGRTFKTMEIYQEMSNGNYRVRVTMLYDMKAAIAIAREVMLEELKKDSDLNKAQLEKLMGLDSMTEQVCKNMPSYDEVAE